MTKPILIPALAALAVIISPAQQKRPYSTWSDYGGSADSMQYSGLAQIDKTNVNRLELAWFHPARGPGGRFSFNPLVVDGVMYVVGKDGAVMALDAATGKQLCSHPTDGQPTNRGFNYWESKDRPARRLIFAVNSYLENPAAGVPAGRGGRAGFTPPPVPPPPPGQIRYYGPFGNTMLARNGLIALSPPWSELVAYDLNQGTIKWRIPICTTREVGGRQYVAFFAAGSAARNSMVFKAAKLPK